jgi:hypothetical protein
VTSAVPEASPSPAPRREKRLVLRLLEAWRLARIDDLAPKAGALGPGDTGEDMPHVFTIELSDTAPPRFGFIGDAVCPRGVVAADKPLVADCPNDSVLGHVSRHWQEIIARGVPVTRGGNGINDGKPVLYRGLMAPLVDEDGVICTIIGAANWRSVDA